MIEELGATRASSALQRDEVATLLLSSLLRLCVAVCSLADPVHKTCNGQQRSAGAT